MNDNRLNELVKKYSFRSYNIYCEMPVIFLSGAMTGLSEAEQKGWRKYLKNHFDDTYYVIDPTVFDAESDDENTQKLGHDFDLCGITNCDYFVVNLNKAAQSVGTCQEIMYAWLLKKPILGFWESKEYVQPLHPWIKNKLSNKFKSIEALKIYFILEYYNYKYKAKENNNE